MEEQRMRYLEKEIEKLKRIIRPGDLHTQAKVRMVEALRKHKEFYSKRRWGLCARVSMDTFYRIIEEVELDLHKEGYEVTYIPVFRRNNATKIYRYRVRLSRV